MTSSTESKTTAEVDAAVRNRLDGIYKAWGDNDADAFVAGYTADATAILPGSFRNGRESIRQHMADGFAGPLKGSSTVNNVLDVRMTGDDSALAITEDGILLAGETEVPPARIVLGTWVFTQRDGDWLIAAYHNCARTVS
jgi:uncharacterized protein (TIGR02246 family)